MCKFSSIYNFLSILPHFRENLLSSAFLILFHFHLNLVCEVLFHSCHFSGRMVVNSVSHSVKERKSETAVHSGKAYVHFYSDAAYSIAGFNISYRYVHVFITEMLGAHLDTCTLCTCQGCLLHAFLNTVLVLLFVIDITLLKFYCKRCSTQILVRMYCVFGCFYDTVG